jgi:hypothetical protein
MAIRAVIISTLELRFADGGENAALAPAMKARRLSTGAGNGCGDWPGFGEQASQQGRAGAVHGGARGGFGGLQIQTASLTLAGDDYLH